MVQLVQDPHQARVAALDEEHGRQQVAANQGARTIRSAELGSFGDLYHPLPPALRGSLERQTGEVELMQYVSNVVVGRTGHSQMPKGLGSEITRKLRHKPVLLTLRRRLPRRRSRARWRSSLPKRLPRAPKHHVSLEIVQKLQEIWTKYMASTLGSLTAEERSQWESAAKEGRRGLDWDLHGSAVTVLRARNAFLVGMEGVVVMDRQSVLEIAPLPLEPRCHLRRVPKAHCIFRFSLPPAPREVEPSAIDISGGKLVRKDPILSSGR